MTIKQQPLWSDMPGKTLKFDVVGLRHHLATAEVYDLERKVQKKPLKAKFVAEPDNKVDPHAVKVIVCDSRVNSGDDLFIGYLRKTVAPVISKTIEDGSRVDVKLTSVSTYWMEAKVTAKFYKTPAN